MRKKKKKNKKISTLINKFNCLNSSRFPKNLSKSKMLIQREAGQEKKKK